MSEILPFPLPITQETPSNTLGQTFHLPQGRVLASSFDGRDKVICSHILSPQHHDPKTLWLMNYTPPQFHEKGFIGD